VGERERGARGVRARGLRDRLFLFFGPPHLLPRLPSRLQRLSFREPPPAGFALVDVIVHGEQLGRVQGAPAVALDFQIGEMTGSRNAHRRSPV
jgi:hypothetical protein